MFEHIEFFHVFTFLDISIIKQKGISFTKKLKFIKTYGKDTLSQQFSVWFVSVRMRKSGLLEVVFRKHFEVERLQSDFDQIFSECVAYDRKRSKTYYSFI